MSKPWAFIYSTKAFSHTDVPVTDPGIPPDWNCSSAFTFIEKKIRPQQIKTDIRLMNLNVASCLLIVHALLGFDVFSQYSPTATTTLKQNASRSVS